MSGSTIPASDARHDPSTLPRLLGGPAGTAAVSLDQHLALHGLPQLNDRGDALADAVEAARLHGRGGAAFPTARKLRALAATRGRLRRRPLAIVANGSEGEPASSKDRTLLARSPHLVLDGLQLAALSLGAERAYVAVRERSRGARSALAAALAERAAVGRDRVPVTLAAVPDGFVVGEERALVNVLNGGPPLPTRQRPWERGVDGAPTLVQNVETLAHVALIAAHGPEWFRAIGDPGEPGSTLVTVSGGVPRAGVVEVAMGTPLETIVATAGGTLAAGGALLVGGYAGGWLPAATAHQARLLRSELVPLGASVGCGAIVALPASACGVAETARLTRWLADESAGQCGPCVHGLDAIAGALEALTLPRRPLHDPLPDLRRWCGDVAGRGACGHPDGVVRMVRSALRTFAAELDDHVRHGACERCEARPTLPLPAAWGPIHTHRGGWRAAA